MNQKSISEKTERTARDAASEAAHNVKEAAEELKSTAKEQYDRLEKMIRRNPVASVSAAAGVGLLLAMIARR